MLDLNLYKKIVSAGKYPILGDFLDTLFAKYPGSQAPFWGEEVTSPAIVCLNTFLVRLCHPIEGLGGLLTKYIWRDG